MSPDDLGESFRGFIPYIPAFSLENEAEAWNVIYQVAQNSLSLYPTTVEEDC